MFNFHKKKDKEPRGIIPLENVNVREVDDKTKQFCFEIYSTTNDKIKACKHDSEGKVIEGIERMKCIYFVCLKKLILVFYFRKLSRKSYRLSNVSFNW